MSERRRGFRCKETMASFTTFSSTVITINHPLPRSTFSSQFSISIACLAPIGLSSSSSTLPSTHGSPHLYNGATRRLPFDFSRSCLFYTNSRIVAGLNRRPLKIMISGAPASGKGTQSELIKSKYGLVHIAAGDLLRAEVRAGTVNGKLAKQYMEKGNLVPNEIVVEMVKERVLQPDSHENGWLLDGYPRSLSQAKALENLGIWPDLFILLDVNENALVDRVVGRRLDPLNGKIYHLQYSPPENEKIAARLVQRFDDTEAKVKLRLKTHHQNVESVLSFYKDIIVKVNGNLSKEVVYGEIDSHLSSFLQMNCFAPDAMVR